MPLSQNASSFAIRPVYKELESNLTDLNSFSDQNKGRKQKAFLRTLLSIMDNVCSELTETVQKHQQLDYQVDQNEKCLVLGSKRTEMRMQWQHLCQEINERQQCLHAHATKNHVLKLERDSLHQKISKAQKKLFKNKLFKNKLFQKNQLKTLQRRADKCRSQEKSLWKFPNEQYKPLQRDSLFSKPNSKSVILSHASSADSKVSSAPYSKRDYQKELPCYSRAISNQLISNYISKDVCI